MKIISFIIGIILINFLLFGCIVQSPEGVEDEIINEVVSNTNENQTNNVVEENVVSNIKSMVDSSEKVILTKDNPIKELLLKSGEINIQYHVVAKKYMACGLYTKDKVVEQGIFLFSTAMTPGVSSTQGSMEHTIKIEDTYFIICTMADDSDTAEFIIKQ
jgi:hypothetical protein